MNVFNEDLIKSLAQDVHVIIETNDEIAANLDTVEYSCWFLSCKDEKIICSNLSDIGDNTNEERYLATLEVVIDKIYLFLNYLLKFVETEWANGKSRESKYILRPKNLTLGTMMKILWRQINDNRPESISNERSQMTQTLQMTKCVQTDQSCFDNCYTCNNIYDFVKRIIELFKNRFGSYGINKEITDIRQNIYTLTQHSCTDKYLCTIKNIMEDLEEENNLQKCQLEKFSAEIETKDSSYVSLSREYKKLKENYAELNENLQKEKENHRRINLKHTDLNNQYNLLQKRLSEESEKYKRMQSRLLKTEEDFSTLESKKNELENEVQEIKITNKLVIVEKEKWKERFLEENKENQNIKKDLSNTLTSVKEIKKQLNKIQNDYKELSQLLTRNTSDYKNTVYHYNKIIKKLKDLIFLKFSSENKVDKEFEDYSNAVIQIEGNPLADMTNQVSANEIFIKNLQNKNNHLLRIIENLKKIENK